MNTALNIIYTQISDALQQANQEMDNAIAVVNHKEPDAIAILTHTQEAINQCTLAIEHVFAYAQRTRQ